MTDRIGIATALICHCEGLRLAPYQDLRGLWTIGFGNRFSIDGSSVTADTQPIQAYQADALLRDTLLMDVAPAVQRLVNPMLGMLQENELGSLFSLVYNIGADAFRGSTMLRMINAGQVIAAAGQFTRWAYCEGRLVKGLVARRALEHAVYLDLVDPPDVPPISVPGAPHPVFASNATTDLTADDLNAEQLRSPRT